MKTPKPKVVFLTGGTGHVGRNLIPVLLEAEDVSLVLLLRGRSEADAAARLDGLLAELAGSLDLGRARARVRAVRGDVTQDRLGLSAERYEELAASVTHLVHSAATVKFRTPLAEARQINVEGTRRVMEFARFARRHGRLERVAHISTAFVSGDRPGLILEDELDTGQEFTNSYERSKFEAERLVRERFSDLPWVILRPSIIVGDSRTGATTTFNVLYIPMKYLARGLVRFLPGSPDTPIDIVPVDYVCRAAARLLFSRGAVGGRTFHLCAGPRGETTIGHVLELAEDFFGKRDPGSGIPRLRFVSGRWLTVVKFVTPFLSRPMRRAVRKLRWFVPYLGIARAFDVSSVREVLDNDPAVEAPAFESYFRTLLEYCVRTNWGETAAAPARVLTAPAPQEA